METHVATQEYFATQIFRDKDGACPLVTIGGATTASTNNQIVAAVTGKRICVVFGWFVSAGAAISTATFKSNNSATLINLTAPANTVAEPNVPLPWNPGGNFETVAGEKLTLDVGTTTLGWCLRYYVYTP